MNVEAKGKKTDIGGTAQVIFIGTDWQTDQTKCDLLPNSFFVCKLSLELQLKKALNVEAKREEDGHQGDSSGNLYWNGLADRPNKM